MAARNIAPGIVLSEDASGPFKSGHFQDRTEAGVKYTQDNALKGCRFESIEEQNAHLRRWNGATIISTNRPIDDWGKILGDNTARSAILDRFLRDHSLPQRFPAGVTG